MCSSFTGMLTTSYSLGFLVAQKAREFAPVTQSGPYGSANIPRVTHAVLIAQEWTGNCPTPRKDGTLPPVSWHSGLREQPAGWKQAVGQR